MVGVYRTRNIPVIGDEGKTAVTEEEKAEMLASTFQKAHSSDNIGRNYRIRREEILKQHQDIYTKRIDSQTALDAAFNMWELKRVLMRVRNTAPGKDRICYNMIKQMDEVTLKVLFRAVQKLIAINRIQNKSLCLHNIFVCAVYNYFVERFSNCWKL